MTHKKGNGGHRGADDPDASPFADVGWCGADA